MADDPREIATATATATEGDVSTICEAFAWTVRDSRGPISVPLRDLTQAQWDQLVQQLGRPARRMMRMALERMP